MRFDEVDGEIVAYNTPEESQVLRKAMARRLFSVATSEEALPYKTAHDLIHILINLPPNPPNLAYMTTERLDIFADLLKGYANDTGDADAELALTMSEEFRIEAAASRVVIPEYVPSNIQDMA
jgi:hypothetical protein